MKLGIFSDLHCGHKAGLTPPGWWESSAPRLNPSKWDKVQRECWNWFERNVKAAGPFDVVIINGDAIDGKGTKSGGSELITSDREEQCEMAAYVISKITTANTKIIMTYGTAYHTGDGEDWENKIASDVGAEKIGSHEWVDIKGTIFDCKHHCSSSSVPHGRHTAVAKEKLWNTLWHDERKQCPRAHVIIRSHVHYFKYCGDVNWLGMTTPALQGLGSKFGARRCSGIVDYGFIVFNVTGKRQYSWTPYIGEIKSQVSKAIKIA